MYQPGQILMEVRACHAERPEDPLFAKQGKRFPAHALHDLREQCEASTGIEILRARREIQMLLTEQHAQNLVLADDVFHAPTGEGQGLPASRIPLVCCSMFRMVIVAP